MNKPSALGVEEIDRGYAAILTHYAKTAFPGDKEPLTVLVETDTDMVAALPLPHESDKLKLKEIFEAKLKKLLERKEGDLDTAIELALKLGRINKLESDQIYGLEDLDEMLNAHS